VQVRTNSKYFNGRTGPLRNAPWWRGHPLNNRLNVTHRPWLDYELQKHNIKCSKSFYGFFPSAYCLPYANEMMA